MKKTCFLLYMLFLTFNVMVRLSFAQEEARPLQNAPFCPISVSSSNFSPLNTPYIPAVKTFAFHKLEQKKLEQKSAFFKGLKVKVRWVIDGDTIILMDGRHIRYIGINTPEIENEHQKAEPYGYQAKEYNEKLVFSKTVYLQFDKERHDHFGRLLAYVFLPDGTFINQTMIAQGYAYLLPQKPNIKYAKILLQAQREAILAKKVIWREMAEEEGGYLGNRRTKRFHASVCPFGKKISPTNRISFKNKRDAFWAGFAPGKQCLAGKIIAE